MKSILESWNRSIEKREVFFLKIETGRCWEMFSELLNLPSGKELKLIDIRCLWTSYLYYSNLCTLIVPRMELEKNISISKWQKSIKVANQFKTLEIPHFSHLILQLYLECLGGRELGGGIYCNKITNVAQVGNVDLQSPRKAYSLHKSWVRAQLTLD